MKIIDNHSMELKYKRDENLLWNKATSNSLAVGLAF